MAMENRARLALFKNENKDGDNHPDLTGIGNMSKSTLQTLVDAIRQSKGDEIELDCAAWFSTSKGGKDYTSVSFGLKDPKYSDINSGKAAASKDDMDVPF